MGYLLAALGAYLLGCSNMALYISKLKKIDIQRNGTGNLGASNATILLGWGAGVAVAIHDMGKAVLAVFLAQLLFPELENIRAVVGVACVLGHMFPFYLKFRGGKGFASYLGMTLAINWKFALAVLALVVIVTLVTDYIVVGTVTTILSVPVYMGFTLGWAFAGILFLATGAILWKHRENLVRIFRGTELGLRSAIRGENRVT